MKNPIRSAVVALLILCAVGAPLASAVGNGAMSKPARFPAAPVAQQQAAATIEMPEMTIPAVQTIPEVQVVGRVQHHAAARKTATVAAPSFTHCVARDLEQGGTFRQDLTSGLSGSVIVCG
jgi:hypothetical protein